MPELPEVETVRKQLAAEIVGATICELVVLDLRCFEGPSWQGSEQVIEIKRGGKYIFVVFASGRGMQIHLKMTGRLVMEDFYETAKHTRVKLKMIDGRRIYYWDTRMFGYIKLVEDIARQEKMIRAKLGPEPWEISDKELSAKLQKTGRTIKDTILDQSFLAGIGNIYANDALWLAKINPRRKANSLKKKEVAELRKSIISVLDRGLALGGASDNTYRDFYGGKGGYQNEFLTYGRTGEPCNRCGAKIERIVVGGRGTWICEKCQK